MPESDIRITPQWLIELARVFAGDRLLLDVCTEASNPTRADAFYTERHDGLNRSWRTVTRRGDALITAWCNPPYSRGQVKRWSVKAVQEARLGAEILFLTKDDCRTGWNRYLAENTDARCRIARGVGFLEPNSEGGYEQLVGPRWGSCLWYWGQRRRRFERIFSGIGEVAHGLGPSEHGVGVQVESEAAE